MASAVETQASGMGAQLTRPLVLWHLLSLDAPTVAVLWACTFGRSAGVALAPAWLAAVFVAVWILYAADRLLDTRASPTRTWSTKGFATEWEERHRFHARHRQLFRAVLAAASLALVPLVLAIPAEAMRLYLVLAAVLGVWVLLIHLSPVVMPAVLAAVVGRPALPLPKEFAVGLFFSAASAIPALAGRLALWLQLLPATLLFAALCSLNCVFIHAWEHPGPANQAAAPPSLRFALRHVRACTWGLLLAGVSVGAHGFASPPALAVALSAALLLILDRWPPADATLLRAAADLALLSPVLFLFRATVS